MSFILALDAGHGYNTAGKRIPDGTREWTLNSKVCNYVQEILKDYDVKVIRLDDVTGKTDVPLQSGRMSKAVANKVDACISVHHNAGPGTGYGNYSGVEVIINNYASSECKNLANNILKYLPSKTGLKRRGDVKYSTYFTMVMKQSFPTMIIEGGFMNGTNDSKVIKTTAYQKGYAQAIVDGLVATYPDKIVKKTTSNTTTAKPATSNTTSNKKTTKVTTGNLWLRKTPDTKSDSNKIVVIPKGTKVTILDNKKVNSVWYKIEVTVKGKKYTGYSSSTYMK